jgi:triosephosphate isomerase
MRRLVIGNWKMNLDFVEAIHLTQQLGVLVRQRAPQTVEVVVAPPFVDLRSVSSVIEADRLRLSVCAQHVYPQDHGPFTGEISVGMLKRLGVTSVLVGHSERRLLFGMDDDTVRATLEAVVNGGLCPVLCVGETEAVRDGGQHLGHVADQVKSALGGVEPGNLVVAYEPVWAIGTGRVAEASQLAEMAEAIRAALGTDLGRSTPVLYGGSVVPDTVDELAIEGRVDGFLVGGASLRAEEFCAIVGIADDCYR